MPGTYSKLLVHVIFSTGKRVMAIKPEIEERLFAYVGGIIRDERGALLAAGGMPDHVHLLVRVPTDLSVADLVRNAKARSSAWLHETFRDQRDFAWQAGYGAFSVSPSQYEAVRRYIADQKGHHRGRSFQEEFVGFLSAHGIEYDERYLWD